MKFYLYDEKTKQFIKEQEGYLDPLETKAQGKNVYIVPPFSTAEMPDLTNLKDNEILVFDEYWELKNRLATCETVAEVEAIAWPEAGK